MIEADCRLHYNCEINLSEGYKGIILLTLLKYSDSYKAINCLRFVGRELKKLGYHRIVSYPGRKDEELYYAAGFLLKVDIKSESFITMIKIMQ